MWINNNPLVNSNSGRDTAQRVALKALDDFRNCVAGETMMLRQENTDMKIRLSKFGEIEMHLKELMVKERHMEDQIESLTRMLHSQQLQIDSMRNTLNTEKTTKDEMERQLQHQVLEYQKEMAWRSNQMDKAKCNYENIIRDLKRQTAADIQDIRDQFFKALREKQQAIDKLEGDLDAAYNQFGRHSQGWEDTQHKLTQQYQRNAHNYADQIQHLRDQNRMIETQLNRVAECLADQSRAYQQIKINNAHLEDANQQLMKNLREAEHRVQQLGQDARVLELNCYDRDNKIKEVGDLSETLRTEHRMMSEQLSSKCVLVDRLRQDIAKLETEKNGLSERVKKVQTDKQFMRETYKLESVKENQLVSELESQLSHKTTQIKDLLYAVGRLEGQLLQYQENLRDADRLNSALEQKASSAVNELEKCKSEIRNYQNKLAIEQSHIMELETLIEKERINRNIDEIARVEANFHKAAELTFRPQDRLWQKNRIRQHFELEARRQLSGRKLRK